MTLQKTGQLSRGDLDRS